MSLRRSAPLLFALACASAARADLDTPEEWVRNPSLGLYKGYAEFKMARYDAARRIWETLGARGGGQAYFNLGILYEDGLGVAPDLGRAIAYYELAAREGSRSAQYRLGMLYAAGDKLAADPERARHWLTAAAAAGDADAAAALDRLEGRAASGADSLAAAEALYRSGRYEEAARAYRSLAERGSARALARLGWLYEAGRGVERDLGEAARLFRRAAQAGDAEAQYALAVMLATGAGQARDEAESLQWLKQAAAQGHPEARAALEGDANP